MNNNDGAFFIACEFAIHRFTVDIVFLHTIELWRRRRVVLRPLARIICFGRIQILIIVVKHAQAPPPDVCLILICRNRCSLVNFPRGAYANGCVRLLVCVAPTLFSPLKFCATEENQYAEAAKVNMNTQNAMLDSHTHIHGTQAICSNFPQSHRYLISFIAKKQKFNPQNWIVH